MIQLGKIENKFSIETPNSEQFELTHKILTALGYKPESDFRDLRYIRTNRGTYSGTNKIMVVSSMSKTFRAMTSLLKSQKVSLEDFLALHGKKAEDLRGTLTGIKHGIL